MKQLINNCTLLNSTSQLCKPIFQTQETIFELISIFMHYLIVTNQTDFFGSGTMKYIQNTPSLNPRQNYIYACVTNSKMRTYLNVLFTSWHSSTSVQLLTCNSSSVKFSPNSFATLFKLLKDILPYNNMMNNSHRISTIFTVSSSSNSLKALRISSLESFSLILTVIICKNWLKSMVPVRWYLNLMKSKTQDLPVPSLSISAIIFLISSFFGSKPNALMAT